MNDKLILYILLMAVITYLTRFPMLVLSSRVEMPSWVQRGLRMVPVGVFSSLTIPPILFHTPANIWNPEYMVAGAFALWIGLWKKQIVLSLLVGVGCLVLWRII
ncbi:MULTISPECIES: AzlD domain-containing protein [Aneurinibacillus]|uniref:AzlD domain-containing protein n=1 Tax=Aneurinibacillus thermoaerophilus TaxID=143495 RepID=A0A1G8AY65_ANETH|nr:MULTISPECIES: AzlD domain-containing protein [Aneurinibacillus]MED0675187.1 AzlD domain-containing protein [Aneurinibacillus thermoaerophilus]MED0680118.1 AzlD domain-containing protein [Aneurinibacillus thermoaerophilus]MED0738125.1 AzlD domain-containing protein [Aneurinibacillus thermoaerophilus]MED0758257.1 AzlD domain-containing protein [Aneurinibacillus thermoaerophilus]MED0761411.1 AzlD domain-containing protein [Aneurinibacillus thermoaerophilus]